MRVTGVAAAAFAIALIAGSMLLLHALQSRLVGDIRDADRNVLQGQAFRVLSDGLAVPSGVISVRVAFTTFTFTPAATSTSTRSASTLVTLPTIPPPVTTLSPFLTASIMARCAFIRCCCGRIIKNQKIRPIRMNWPKKKIVLAVPPDAVPPAAWAKAGVANIVFLLSEGCEASSGLASKSAYQISVARATVAFDCIKGD